MQPQNQSSAFRKALAEPSAWRLKSLLEWLPCANRHPKPRGFAFVAWLYAVQCVQKDFTSWEVSAPVYAQVNSWGPPLGTAHREALVAWGTAVVLSSPYPYDNEKGLLGLALAATDEDVRQILIKRLTDDDLYIRQGAVQLLAPLAATDATVRQILIPRLTDKDLRAREFAVAALGPLAATNEAVRQALMKRLTDHVWDVRCGAVDALGPLAADDAAVRQALMKRLTDYNWDVRRTAMAALAPLAALAATDAIGA